jgi:hypothetical protein
MSKHYLLGEHLAIKVGMVSVQFGTGTQEQVLFKVGNQYRSYLLDEVDKHLQPVESKILAELIGNEKKLNIIRDVCELVNGPMQQWATGRRHRQHVRARQTFFWALRTCTSYTLVEISNFVFGNYDHATIIHARKAIDNEIEMMNDEVMHCVTQIATALQVNGCDLVQKRMEALMNRNANRKKLMKQNRDIIA